MTHFTPVEFRRFLGNPNVNHHRLANSICRSVINKLLCGHFNVTMAFTGYFRIHDRCAHFYSLFLTTDHTKYIRKFPDHTIVQIISLLVYLQVYEKIIAWRTIDTMIYTYNAKSHLLTLTEKVMIYQ